jgi:hypothetical protein
MTSTRSKPLFNCFRAHVHASTRCRQSKEARFQQPFMEANVKGGPGPLARTLADSDGPGFDAAAFHAILCIRPNKTRLKARVLHLIELQPLSWQCQWRIKCFQFKFFKFHWVFSQCSVGPWLGVAWRHSGRRPGRQVGPVSLQRVRAGGSGRGPRGWTCWSAWANGQCGRWGSVWFLALLWYHNVYDVIVWTMIS